MLHLDFEIKELNTNKLRGFIMELVKRLKTSHKTDKFHLKYLKEALQELIFRGEFPSDVKMSLGIGNHFGLKLAMTHLEHKTKN